MNNTQRYILLYGAIAATLVLFFPPWVNQDGFFTGYNFFLSFSGTYDTVDWSRLFVTLAIVAFGTAMVWIAESIIRN